MPKNRLIPLVFAAVLAGCSGGDSGGGGVVILIPRWASQYRLPTSSNLRAVAFANANQGIVAGEASSFLRTDNGTDTVNPLGWTQHEHFPYTGGGDVVDMSVLGGSAWAVGTDPSGNGRYWYSPDGRQWISVTPTLGGTDPLVAVSATTITPPQAYLLQADGDILVVTDGLETLRSELPTDVDSGPWHDIKIIPNSPVGWAVGDGGRVAETEDGGSSWTLLTSPTVDALRGIFLENAPAVNFGYACGDNGTVLKLLPNSGTPPPVGELFDASGGGTGGLTLVAIDFPLDVDTGWAVGNNGGTPVIQKTTDAGVSWNPQTLPAGIPPLYDIWFVDEMIGYAVGDSGTILRTLDGGATPWEDVTQGTLDQFNAVDFTSDGVRGVAVGNGGVIIRTVDGGATWTSSSSGTGNDLYGVSIPDAGSGNVAYACGANGTLITTSDLGATPWTGQTHSAGAVALRAIHFPGNDLAGVCVGDGPAAIFTADGGATPWSTATTAPGGNGHALSDDKAGTYYASGAAGLVAASTDGGDTWAAVAPGAPAASTLRGIQSPSGANMLFAAADNGNVYWQMLAAAWNTTTPTAPARTGRGLAFVDALNGWAVMDDNASANGGIFYTEDGAATWLASPDHTYSMLRAIWMSPTVPDLGYAVGDNGTILKTTVGGKQ